jgi:hypothetical protein
VVGDEDMVPAKQALEGGTAPDDPASLGGVLSQWSTWKAPLTYVGTPLAALGGYGLADKLLKWRKHQAMRQEAEDARNEYRQLLTRQHEPVDLEKLSTAFESLIGGTVPADSAWAKAAAALEQLADVCEADCRQDKTAAEGAPMVDRAIDWLGKHLMPWQWGGSNKAWSAPASMYLTGAIPLGLGAGALGYNYARKADPEAAKAKALRESLEEDAYTQAPPVYARLVPTSKGASATAKSAVASSSPPDGAASPEGVAPLDPRERAARFVRGLLRSRDVR